MKLNKLYSILASISLLTVSGLHVSAQSVDEQVLIFRNTGEVNLLYHSQIDSITMQNIDSAGVIYDEPIAQLFYTTDTVLYVPISEIDSVCFGNRNEVEFKRDVRILDDSDIAWILSTYENTIHYSLNTPDSYLPKQGEKLFYGSSDDLFPIGLCAKVDRIERNEDYYEIIIKSADFTEVFNKFFYAGDVSDNIEITNNSIRRAPRRVSAKYEQVLKLEAEGLGSITGKIGISAKGPVVIRPLLHRYSAIITLENTISCDVEFECADPIKREDNTQPIHIPLGRVMAVFIPSIDLSFFYKMNASLNFNYYQDWGSKVIIDWKREDGNNTFNIIEPTPNGNMKGEANCDIMLDGDLFCGGQIDFNFNLTGDLIGSKASLRIGPHFEAEINAGVLLDLAEWHYNDQWNPNLYAKGDLSFDLQGSLDFYEIHREAFIWGSKTETRLGGIKVNLYKKTLHLFPEFDNTRATENRKKNEADVSMSTLSDTPIEYPLETGFQLIDANQDKIVDSLFVGELRSNIETVQGVVADIEINDPVIVKDSLFVRPVFHYAGYTIPYRPIAVSDNAPIQPVISYGNTSSVIYASGTPIVGTYRNDSTTYHVGPYVPVGYKKNNVFSTFSTYIYGKSNGNNGSSFSITNDDLIGTWASENSTTSLSLTFNDDKTGILTEADSINQSFTYEVNTPSKQYVSLITPNETIVIKIVSVEDDKLTIYYKNHYANSMYMLIKKD